MTANIPKTFHFKAIVKGSKNVMALEEPSVDLTWGDPEDGFTLELDFVDSGATTVMFPFPFLFEESQPEVDPDGQIFEVGAGENLVLTVRPRTVIEQKFADEGLALPIMDGTVNYSLFVFDHDKKTAAEKNSPPPIKLGP
jgi:hypothetical protein